MDNLENLATKESQEEKAQQNYNALCGGHYYT
jgi:hypothetical protein